MEHASTNALIHESSPYLLQHAHNPVNWFPWSDEILARAKQEDKPLLVSIGYAACHWCHVMERESFEDAATAVLMNELFINVKIDREERPDLDHIYMDAVQAMSGSGGWPLNVFLTPEGKPFYGGTYFPPVAAFNRPSWTEVLNGVATAFRDKREDIEQQAGNLTDHLVKSNDFGINSLHKDADFNEQEIHEMFEALMKMADRDWGGFGRAPKFPQTLSLRFLLRYHYYYHVQEALDHAVKSIDAMIDGGIYDQAGGGFARYSTDDQWLAPHFEKMLYDNALLVSLISEAYQVTGNERYRGVVEATIGFVEREMMLPEGGFLSALDADSEGVEGKFYVWSKAEIESALGEDAAIFCAFYDVTDAGNWEGENILHRTASLEDFALKQGLNPEFLAARLDINLKLLLNIRSERVRPATDDKVLLGWNALMNSACSRAYAATGNRHYLGLAQRNMSFLLEAFVNGTPSKGFHHSFKEGTARIPAFLDDYAYLAEALILLQEITGNLNYGKTAKAIVTYVHEKFADHKSEYFFYTNIIQKDVIVRKKEVTDGAVPSGNAVLAWVLHYLGIFFDIGGWRKSSAGMMGGLKQAVTRHPVSFGAWSNLLINLVVGSEELVLLAGNEGKVHEEILHIFMPHRVYIKSAVEDQSLPLLKGKNLASGPQIFLCKNYACKSPVDNVELLKLLLVE